MRHHLHKIHLSKLTNTELLLMLVIAIEPIANIPQVIKVYTTKSAEDFFVWTWVMGLIANIAWLIYGANVKKTPIILSALTWLSIHLSMTIGILLHG